MKQDEKVIAALRGLFEVVEVLLLNNENLPKKSRVHCEKALDAVAKALLALEAK